MDSLLHPAALRIAASGALEALVAAPLVLPAENEWCTPALRSIDFTHLASVARVMGLCGFVVPMNSSLVRCLMSRVVCK